MSIRIIACVDNQGGFGKGGKIPWNYPEDMKHFKEKTTNHVCIMGRKTYEDMRNMMKKRKIKIGDSILPNRICYVVSSKTNLKLKGATQVSGLREVTDRHPEHASPYSVDKHIYILGGERMFVQGLSHATHINLTVLDIDAECDRFFPVDKLSHHYTITSGEKITSADGTAIMFTEYSRTR